jgi:pilus assembly protein CpaC
LLDKRLTETASKIPGLGDIPILGKLFRSRSKQRSDSELLVIVTPTLVRPIPPGQAPPPPPSLELQRMRDEGMLSGDKKEADDKKDGEVGPRSQDAGAEEGVPTPVPTAEADVTAPATPLLEVVDSGPLSRRPRKEDRARGGGRGRAGGTRQ